jgi:hypothetical protein
MLFLIAARDRVKVEERKKSKSARQKKGIE